MIEAEVEELVRRLINDLPERCRTVFLLNRQEGLSSREIAEALSLSESTVRVQIKIAVDRIVAGIRTHYPDLKLVPCCCSSSRRVSDACRNEKNEKKPRFP